MSLRASILYLGVWECNDWLSFIHCDGKLASLYQLFYWSIREFWLWGVIHKERCVVWESVCDFLDDSLVHSIWISWYKCERVVIVVDSYVDTGECWPYLVICYKGSENIESVLIECERLHMIGWWEKELFWSDIKLGADVVEDVLFHVIGDERRLAWS